MNIEQIGLGVLAGTISIALMLLLMAQPDPRADVSPIPDEIAVEVVTRMHGETMSARKATKLAVDIMHERSPRTEDGSPAPHLVYGAAVQYASGAVDWNGFLDIIGFDEVGKAQGRR